MTKKLLVLPALWFLIAATPGAAREWLEATRPTKTYQDLGGEWARRDMQARPYFQVPLPAEGWEKCPVPLRQDVLPKCVYRWWQRDFTLGDAIKQALDAGDCAILHVGGRSMRWQARLNGRELIDSLDPFNPFDLDVTGFLRRDGANTLVIGTTDALGVCQDNQPRKFIVPRANGLCTDNMLWGDVELRMRPKDRMEDVFVKTSWRKKQIDVDVEVLNAGDGWQVGGRVIDQAGKTALEIPFTNSAGLQKGVRLFTLAQKWTDPIPWNVDNPHLYRLATELRDPAGNIRDRRQVEFGFREIWVEGPDLVLNGRRLFLARKTIWPPMPAPAKIKEIVAEHAKSPGINTLRVNRDAYYSFDEFAWHADRLGLMLVPQNLCGPTSHDIFKPVLWNNYFEFIERWIRADRNHPSIVMWSLSNEALWCLYNDDRDHYISGKLQEAAQIAQKVDPTRLAQFDGDWDLPPEGEAAVVNLHYPLPETAYRYPTECWKFFEPAAPFPIRGLTGKYTWIGAKAKPIIVGEFIWMWSDGNRPWSDTMYGGDKVFDWDYWRSRKVFNQNLRWFTDIWRVARYAGVNPWSHERSDFKLLIPLETVVLRDQFRTFFSDEDVTLRAWALNDTPVDHAYTVQWSVLKGAEIFFTRARDLDIPAGGLSPLAMDLKMPKTERAADMDFKIEIFRQAQKEKRFDETYPIRIHPQAPLVWPGQAVLFDPVGQTRAMFAKLGLQPVLIDSLRALDAKSALVIGKDALDRIPAEELRSLIPGFVGLGGNLLCLAQTNWPADFAFLNIYCPFESRANFAWIRAPLHPALAGLKDLDLGLWRPGDWVCDNALEKPRLFTGLPWSPLIDIGDFSGLGNSPLMEVFLGKGRFVLCSMNIEKSLADPGARRLLANLLDDLPRPAPQRSPLHFSGDQNSGLYKFLAASGMLAPGAEKQDRAKVLLVDAASAVNSPASLAALVKAGATAWLYNLKPENIKAWEKLIPGGLDLKPAKIQESCLIDYANYSPLLGGVSHQEFFWASGSWTEGFQRTRKDAKDIHGTYPIAKIADFQISAPNGKPLLDPPVMVEVQEEKGRWLLSTIDFEAGLQFMPVGSFWFFQNVLNNLDVKFKPEKIRKISELHMIDLKKNANFGFQDDVAGDGRGGWSDSGPAFDFRFFPVNLSGVNDIGEPDPPPANFPDVMKFEGVPFQIIDPRSNHGKSMIVMEPRAELLLKSGKHDYLRKAVIPVDRFCDIFYVLHSSGWSVAPPGKLWSYNLDYEDGSKAEQPVRSGLEVGDWYKARPTLRSHVAWRGKCLNGTEIGIYICAFDNPYPDKKVKNIEIVSECKSFGGVFAITVAKTALGEP